jgi:hypothetical protein
MAVPFTSNAGGHITTSRNCSVLDDILYSADQKILFTGLLSLRITDFTWVIEFGGLLEIQVRAFSYFRRDFATKGTPFLHPGALVCGSPTLFRIVCKGSDVSAIDHLAWRGFLFLAESEQVYSPDPYRHEDGHRYRSI